VGVGFSELDVVCVRPRGERGDTCGEQIYAKRTGLEPDDL
jgi:hypothetical protein